jgi:hypothetical protein
MSARIFSPSRTAMQSGQAKTGYWVLEFEQESPLKIEPLMGYTSSSDTRRQVRLSFEKNGIAFRVEKPKEAHRRQISYAENFRYDRKVPWTH